ncbi:MAG: carbohydrate binding family 9 domain-containing protein [Acidobacteria bacterium]|nr:carbohydrate binding family 9 domain-containing protein [Acidobacteriota bacterium]
MKLLVALNCLLLILVAGVYVSAQTPVASPTPAPEKQDSARQPGEPSQTDLPSEATNNRRVGAFRASGEIKIDGRLDESDWQQAEVVNRLRQQEPNEGSAASERTEVRVLFDDKNLYFGIRAFDSDVKNINARELVRDASFSNDDKIELLLDTYHDKRNAFRFAVNPFGTQQDALITDEGRDVNLSWDAAWISEGKRDAKGWTVEIAIPLTTLRFGEGADVWGFNVARIIRRKNEEVLWTSWQREFGLERVSQAGELTGVGEIKRRRLIEVKPYVSGGWQQGTPRIGASGFDAGANIKTGLEVARIGITPSLTAEFTANPDFGQAEVDSQVVNLSRFSIFFPEKRDFFLENAGVFLFGRQGANQLFFTRQIGLNERGQPVPIDYGAKITGKIGSYNAGFLQVQTRSLGASQSNLFVPRQQFTVARVKKDILKRSSIGAIFVNRQGATRFGGSRYNRAYGVDAEFNLTDRYRISGFYARSETPNIKSSVHSARLDSVFENDKFRFIGVYEDVGANFNPEVGFIEREGIRQYFAQAAYKPRPKFLPFVRQMEFEAQTENYYDRRGRLSSRQHELSWETEFKNSSVFFFRPFEDATDVLTEPFEIRRGIVIPVGTYHFNRPRVSFTSDRSKKIGFTTRYKWGEFYTGKRDEFSAGISYRPNEHFLFDFSDSYNNVRLAQGDFTTNLFAGRVNYNLSRKFLSSALLQLNSAAQLTALNIRFRYIYRPNSDFFIIYNQTTGKGLERPSYSLQMKMTYDFTF